MVKVLVASVLFLFSSIVSFAQVKPSNTVTLFYSTTCPICQKMTLTVRELQKQFEGKGLHFVLVFPSQYDSQKKVKRFMKVYGLGSGYATDYDKVLAKQMDATVTPQAILTDSMGDIIYSGKIDNLFEDIGKRRTVITENYLRDAIASYLAKEEIKIKKTEPVGCFIY